MNYNNYLPKELLHLQKLPNRHGINNQFEMSQLQGWIPDEKLCLAIPLDVIERFDNYIIHHYSGFKALHIVTSICDKILDNLNLVNPINIYLYLFDYPHNYETLDRKGGNNGYLQSVNEHYSIVIFRHKFWPKVLIHELLHVIWLQNKLPICPLAPRWDEAVIEAYAVQIAIMDKYISEAEYKHYLMISQSSVLNRFNCNDTEKEEIMGLKGLKTIKAGKLDSVSLVNQKANSFDQRCLKAQKTNILEYLFLSQRINELVFSLNES